MNLITGTLTIPNLVCSILTLSRMLHKHYGEQMVVSNKESEDGYCDIMVQVANYFIIIVTT